ncbi:MAG: ribosomal protein S18-alanine N-acetyltransferase [Armatimonadetes bacterium]|nr:ribosomal protein S18-alanine N-acetyltransferase [Armatimonadota bacterium]
MIRFAALAEEHIPAILEIESKVNSAPWSDRSFRHEITHKDSVFLVMLSDGNVVGYGGIWLVVDEAHVTTIAVSSDYQNQGLGTRLMVELLERAKDAGMTCATLEVRAGNAPAIHLYEKLGFQQAAVRKGYYPDNREDAVVMWLYDLKECDALG